MSSFFLIFGLFLLFITGNIEANAKIISISFCISVAVILLALLLLAISALIRQKNTNRIIAFSPNTNYSKRNIEEFMIIFKKPLSEKIPVTNRSKVSVSEEDWYAAYQQACNDLSPDELESLHS